MKAVITAAGMGTRFLPATKAVPKEMLPLIDTPTIQFVVEEAVKSGCSDILIITGKGKRAIEDHFDAAWELAYYLKKHGKEDLLNSLKLAESANIQYVRQSEPSGLGHAVLLAKNFVNNEPFAVLLGDDRYVSDVPHLKQIIDVHNKLNSGVVSVMEVPKEETSRWGIVAGDFIDKRTLLIKQMVEKPLPKDAPSNLAIAGRYILSPEIFDFLKKAKASIGGEVQLTDSMDELSKIKAMYAYLFKGVRYDIGTKLGYYKAFVEYGLERSDLKDEVKEFLKELAKKL